MKKNVTRGFTLIEMLVVIAIIGILAGLAITGSMRAGEAKRTQATKAVLAQLELAIESYHASLNFYPPDNGNNNPAPEKSLASLYYELVGTTKNGTSYTTLAGNETISEGSVQEYFGRPGFANSQPDGAKNFFKTGMGEKLHAELSVVPDIEIMVAPAAGPVDLDARGGKKVNPWRYNSTNPVHNKNSFDLWAEIIAGGKTNVMGNWRQ